jgi:hypothetical protein
MTRRSLFTKKPNFLFDHSKSNLAFHTWLFFRHASYTHFNASKNSPFCNTN